MIIDMTLGNMEKTMGVALLNEPIQKAMREEESNILTLNYNDFTITSNDTNCIMVTAPIVFDGDVEFKGNVTFNEFVTYTVNGSTWSFSNK